MDSVCLAAVCLLEVCLLMFVTDYTMHLLDHVKKIHFIGCGGSGMYPLIQILTAKGYDISGSDVLDHKVYHLLILLLIQLLQLYLQHIPCQYLVYG